MTALPYHRADGPADAPVLVLGPSLGTTLDSWTPLLPAFTPHWRVVRYDLPGHGGSPAAAGPLTVDDLADGVLALLDKLGVEGYAYAGVSLGGAVGMAIASRPAERDQLASLAVVCSSARFGDPAAWQARADLVRAEGMAPVAAVQATRWFTAGFVAREPERTEAALDVLRGVDAESYAACVAAVGAIDLRDRLAEITAPTLVIGGVGDPATPPDHARIIAGGIPSARLRLLPDASHLAYVEHPDTVAELLKAHLRSPRPADAAAVTAAGMAVRREVLGDAHVDHAVANTDAFTADFQDLITRYAWGEIWTRPGLDRRTRSCITLTALVAGGHLEELAMHVRAALRNGLTRAEIGEVLLQTAIYCGVPAANAAFAVAQRVLREVDAG